MSFQFFPETLSLVLYIQYLVRMSFQFFPAIEVLRVEKFAITNSTHDSEVARSIIVSFLGGDYILSEDGLRDFFDLEFGAESVELVRLHIVLQIQNRLFGQIVFHSESTIDLILNGKESVWLEINGASACVRPCIKRKPPSAVNAVAPDSAANGQEASF